MDKLVATVMTVDVLERAKNSIEKKCLVLTEQLKSNSNAKGELKLAALLEQHARIDEQLTRIYSMKSDIRSSLTDESDMLVAEAEVTANSLAA